MNMWRITTLFCAVVLFACVQVQGDSESGGSCSAYPTIIEGDLWESSKNTTKVFRIGGFASWSAVPAAIPVLNIAISEINSRLDLLPDVKLEFVRIYITDVNKSSSNALQAPQSLIGNYNVSALIGGIYSSETRIGSLISRINFVPHISCTPTSTLLSNKLEYPYLVRINPPDQYQSQGIADMFAKYGWMQAMVIYCDDEYGTYGMSNMVQYTKPRNVTLYSNLIADGQTDFSNNVAIIKGIVQAHNLKVFVVYTQSAEALLIMKELEKQGLTGGSALIYLSSSTSVPLSSFVGCVTTSPRGAVQGQLYDFYSSLWEQYGTNASIGGFAWYYVDAILLYAYALHDLITSGIAFEQITGPMLLAQMAKSNFTGVTGSVTLDSTKDRLGDYIWYSIGPHGINFSNILAAYNPITKVTTHYAPLVWNGDITDPSDGSPTFASTLLDYNRPLAIGLGVFVGIAVLLSFFAAAMLYIYWDNFVKHGSFYSGVIVFGTFFAYASALILLPRQTNALCLAFPWFLGIGFTLTYGCLFIKTWALFTAWRAATQFKRSSVTPVTVLKGVGFYFVIESILLIIWSIVDPPTLRLKKMDNDKYQYQCQSDTAAFWTIFTAIKGAWLLSGVILSIITRSVSQEYSESKSIAYATYNNMLLCAIAVPLSITLLPVPFGTLVIEVSVIVLAFAFTTFILFFEIWNESLFPTSDSGLTSTPSRTHVSGASSAGNSKKKSSSSSFQSSVSSKEEKVFPV